MFRKSIKLEKFLSRRTSRMEHIESKSNKYGVEWQDYSTVDKCNRCQKPFTPLRRKHHCRSCGLIYCSVCTSDRAVLAGSSNPKRVCRSCTPTVENPDSVGRKRPTNAPSKRATTVEKVAGTATSLSFFYKGELESDAKITCSFDTLIASGTVTWYRVGANEAEGGAKVTIKSEHVLMAEDVLYIVGKGDIGHKIQCELVQEAVGQKVAATVLFCATDTTVSKAKPSLAGTNVQIGLRLHKHTLKCDRTTRVCDAPGKYREGETLFLEPDVRGIDRNGDVLLVCRWLRSRQSFDISGNLILETFSPGAKKKSEIKMAKVLYDFDAAENEENEMSVGEGDLITFATEADDDWLYGMGPDGNFGAVPLSYVKVYTGSVDNESDLWNAEKGPDMYNDEEKLARQWRQMVSNFLDFETISEQELDSIRPVEFPLGKADIKHLIVCELEIFKKVGDDVEPIGKAVRSMPIGPIEAAPPRIEDIKIIGTPVVGSILSAQYLYYGGREGPSKFSWVKIKNGARSTLQEFEERTPPPPSTPKATRRKSLHSGAAFDASDPRAYTVQEADVGAKIKVKVCPVRSDGREGKPTASASYFVSGKVATSFPDPPPAPPPPDGNHKMPPAPPPEPPAGESPPSSPGDPASPNSVENKVASTTKSRISRLRKARASIMHTEYTE